MITRATAEEDVDDGAHGHARPGAVVGGLFVLAHLHLAVRVLGDDGGVVGADHAEGVELLHGFAVQSRIGLCVAGREEQEHGFVGHGPLLCSPGRPRADGLVRSNVSALVRARCAAQTVSRWPATLRSAGKPVPQVDGGRLRPQTMPAGGCLAVAADAEHRDQVALGDTGERVLLGEEVGRFVDVPGDRDRLAARASGDSKMTGTDIQDCSRASSAWARTSSSSGTSSRATRRSRRSCRFSSRSCRTCS